MKDPSLANFFLQSDKSWLCEADKYQTGRGLEWQAKLRSDTSLLSHGKVTYPVLGAHAFQIAFSVAKSSAPKKDRKKVENMDPLTE